MAESRLGRGDVAYRPEENEGIVARRKEATAAPEAGSVFVDRPDNEGASSHQFGGGYAPDERVIQKAGPDTAPGP